MPAFVVRTLLVAAGCLLLAPRQASAAPPFVPPAAPPPAPPPPEVTVAPVAPPPPAPPSVGVVVAEPPSGTDHAGIVGRWGIEARRLGEFLRSPTNDARCGKNCPIALNAISLRKWTNNHYAWSAGLALGAGGGSRYEPGAMAVQSWDTYLGLGPTVSANFLLADWHHLAVSLSPQLDALVFIPKGTGPKSFLVNFRGLVEGELHLGFIGVPQMSVGTGFGLLASLETTSKSNLTVDVPAQAGTASEWSIGFSGPQSLWGLVTNMYLRFYF
jgi:hypothetical protein